MNWKKPLIKISSYIRGTKAKTTIKKESHSLEIYSFLVSDSLVDLKDLKAFILNNPWCLDSPRISIKDGNYVINILVLSEEKGRLIEEALKTWIKTDE
ncbi:hypothetical protein [Ekhidna sp.]|uniref:hypothetical protein n=1 Tax=Ekhidna sp. TaxID=2608089 RepID=UPI0032973164